jgi:hypothetical protein
MPDTTRDEAFIEAMHSYLPQFDTVEEARQLR